MCVRARGEWKGKTYNATNDASTRLRTAQPVIASTSSPRVTTARCAWRISLSRAAKLTHWRCALSRRANIWHRSVSRSATSAVGIASSAALVTELSASRLTRWRKSLDILPHHCYLPVAHSMPGGLRRHINKGSNPLQHLTPLFSGVASWHGRRKVTKEHAALPAVPQSNLASA